MKLNGWFAGESESEERDGCASEALQSEHRKGANVLDIKPSESVVREHSR